MNIIKALFAGLLAVWVCIAQNVNISGIVTDTGGTAIEGAAVLLEKGGLVDTTGADGSFTLMGIVGINDQINKSKPHTLSATINNGLMRINIIEKSAVEINTYTLQGKVVSSIKKILGVGTHSMKLPRLGVGVYMYQVQSGGERLLIKNCSISGGTSASTHGSSSTALAKHSMSYDTINDVIAVTKDGYLNYRVIITNSDTSGIEIKMNVCEETVTDADGKVYQAVRIGNQVWTAENLRTTKYNDGTPIPEIVNNTVWHKDTSGAYSYYNNDSLSNAEKYGILYNWHAVNTGKLAPAGWHVPTIAEWDALQDYLITNGYNWDGTTTGNKIGKSMAAKSDWKDWNSLSTTGDVGNDMQSNNSSCFSALPGGCRYRSGNFSYIGIDGNWWSFTEYLASYAYACNLYSLSDSLDSNYSDRESGFSVRLLRD